MLARDWQWILQECKLVKEEFDHAQGEIRLGASLPPRLERLLGCLEKLLLRSFELKQKYLVTALMRSPAIKKAFKTTGECGSPLGSILSLDLKSGNCYVEDRIA